MLLGNYLLKRLPLGAFGDVTCNIYIYCNLIIITYFLSERFRCTCTRPHSTLLCTIRFRKHYNAIAYVLSLLYDQMSPTTMPRNTWYCQVNTCYPFIYHEWIFTNHVDYATLTEGCGCEKQLRASL